MDYKASLVNLKHVTKCSCNTLYTLAIPVHRDIVYNPYARHDKLVKDLLELEF